LKTEIDGKDAGRRTGIVVLATVLLSGDEFELDRS